MKKITLDDLVARGVGLYCGSAWVFSMLFPEGTRGSLLDIKRYLDNSKRRAHHPHVSCGLVLQWLFKQLNNAEKDAFCEYLFDIPVCAEHASVKSPRFMLVSDVTALPKVRQYKAIQQMATKVFSRPAQEE